MLTVISATPSPYARKVRISLLEKEIPFELQTEVPWNSTTQTPKYNPLEKLPVLILGGKDDTAESTALYESHFIMEYIEAKFKKQAKVSLLASEEEDLDARLFAKQVEVIADGICDALVLCLMEKRRPESCQSEAWRDRQMRKVWGGLRQLNEWIKDGREYIVGDKFGLADIAAATVLGFMTCRWPDIDWREPYPHLATYSDRMEQRESFKKTVPSPQAITDKVV